MLSAGAARTCVSCRRRRRAAGGRAQPTPADDEVWPGRRADLRAAQRRRRRHGLGARRPPPVQHAHRSVLARERSGGAADADFGQSRLRNYAVSFEVRGGCNYTPVCVDAPADLTHRMTELQQIILHHFCYLCNILCTRINFEDDSAQFHTPLDSVHCRRLLISLS